MRRRCALVTVPQIAIMQIIQRRLRLPIHIVQLGYDL